MTRESGRYRRYVDETQWEILADFVEGLRDGAPFFFMGVAWVPVLEKAGAITHDDNGNPQASGERLIAAYERFVSQDRMAG